MQINFSSGLFACEVEAHETLPEVKVENIFKIRERFHATLRREKNTQSAEGEVSSSILRDVTHTF